MQKTLKQKIQAQIYFYKQLLDYDSSDSSDYSDTEPIIQAASDLPLKIKNTNECIGTHEEMNQRRKNLLKQLQTSQKKNLDFSDLLECRPLVMENKENINSSDTKVLIETKSKLAQLFRQSQDKSLKIKQLQEKIIQFQIQIKDLQSLLQQKDQIIKQKQLQIFNIKLESEKNNNNWKQKINQFEKNYKQIFQEKSQENQKIRKNNSEKEQQIIQLHNLLKLKDEEIKSIRKQQQKALKSKTQNERLKADVKRLLFILERNQQTEQKSIVHKNIHIESGKKKQRAKSEIPQCHSLKKNQRKLSECFKVFDSRYQSLPSYSRRKNCDKSSYSQNLSNDVEIFLRKWHMGCNNGKFVNSLVDLISSYVDKRVNQTKATADKQYQSLRKEIQRKANQSLTLNQILKQRQIQLKDYPKSSSNAYNHFSQAKSKYLNFSSDLISLNPPLPIIKISEKNKNDLSSLCFVNEKICKKQQPEYEMLEKSIQLHRLNSSSDFLNKNFGKGEIQAGVKQHNAKRKESKVEKKIKTDISVGLDSIISVNKSRSSSKNRKTKSRTKATNFPLQKLLHN